MNSKPSLNLNSTTVTSASSHFVVAKRGRISIPCKFQGGNQFHFHRHSHFLCLDFTSRWRGKSTVVDKRKRRRLPPCSRASELQLQLPLLPFPMDQILIPSESKTLHLYEARYLALLEESLSEKQKLFVHFVLDPIVVGSASAEPSFLARYGCLVVIEKVERLEVGALVSIRGVGRVKIVKFEKADPYLRGSVTPLQDNASENISNTNSKTLELKEALRSLNSLEIKLKTPKETLLQTQTANSLMWAESKPLLDCDEAFIPSPAERLSFAALQPVSGSTQSELLKLQKEKIKAMDVKDTLERLEKSLEIVRDNISVVAAKLAIQSLEMK